MEEIVTPSYVLRVDEKAEHDDTVALERRTYYAPQRTLYQGTFKPVRRFFRFPGRLPEDFCDRRRTPQ